MKKLYYVAVLAVTCPSSLFSATTGTVTITGSVPVSCGISVTTEAGATNIADISAGATDRLVATVSEICNTQNGYTVTLQGTNSNNHTGLFVDSVSSDSHPFLMKYNGSNVNPGGVVTDVNAPTTGVSKQLTISYSADSTLTGTVAATYQETVTFTIAAK